MADLWATLVGTGFMPHGHCYRWEPGILWLNVIADALIALAYYSIPASLFVFMRRRADVVFPWMFGLFGAFIFACGTTHVMAIWTVWQPAYGIEGLMKAATAAVSLVTAVLLVRVLPQALALPSPAALAQANDALASANAALATEVQHRKQAEATMHEQAARLEALSRQLLRAQEVERRTIACELHDQIGQSLTALKLGLGSCRDHLRTSELDESLGLAEQLLQQVRELSLGLRPSLLDDLGLPAALRWFVDRQARTTGWVGRVDTAGLARRLPADVEIACFRIAQEALTNVARHAGARHVTVSVIDAPPDGPVEVVIRDDGRGMNVGAARARALGGASMGILGMEERVSLLGGRFEIVSTIGSGTEVRAVIPLRRDDPRAIAPAATDR